MATNVCNDSMWGQFPGLHTHNIDTYTFFMLIEDMCVHVRVCVRTCIYVPVLGGKAGLHAEMCGPELEQTGTMMESP